MMSDERETQCSADTARGEWLDRHTAGLIRRRASCLRTEWYWSWARLACFVVTVAVWVLIDEKPAAASVVVILGTLLFAWTVRRHHHARRVRRFHDSRVTIAEEARRRVGGIVTLIRSNEAPAPSDPETTVGSLLAAENTWAFTEQESDDLDLHAPPVGLFGLLNRTSTLLGCRRLYDWFLNPLVDAESIRTRQDSVRWLDRDPERRFQLMAGTAGLRGRDEYLEQLVRTLRQASPLGDPARTKMLRIWSLLSGLFFVVAIYQAGIGRSGWGIAFVLVALVNALIYRGLHRGLVRCLAPWRRVAPAVEGYLIAARQAAIDLPQEGELGKLRDALGAVSDDRVLPLLLKRIAWAQSGGPVHAFFNVLLFLDLHIAAAILNKALPHRDELLDGLSALADLDALTSLACFGWEQPVCCYPELSNEQIVAITGGRHPLIDPQEVVANDVRLDTTTRMWMVSGSNMAGKSTLLRVVGANVLLAQMGAAVAAEKMTISPMRLITDLQARDCQAKDESYFLAEVRQLRRMVAPPEGRVPVLGIVDEPLRGTNSREQIAAGVAVVEHLRDSAGFFLFATHEQSLMELADGRVIQNHHFRESIDDDGLVFDYRLRPGPAQTRNALRILEREGYPSSILDRAHRWLDESP